MPNRLAHESSPYLLQHKDNPVDWFAWGDEAFERAKQENKPVFLSIGYSSCHWCHVMAHESFEDDEVAAVLNQHFVSVKVDREERPDVDDAYMTAVQMMSGRGGWPVTVFLTPDRRPFFAGTYFPKNDREQHPGFITLCREIANAWQTRPSEILQGAESLSGELKRVLAHRAPEAAHVFDEAFLEQTIHALLADFDPEYGGFGAAPKFPPHTCLSLLFEYGMWKGASKELAEAALNASVTTIERMIRGGIHDHVGGGFHRYSTDEAWHLPHFEKMLYDNALMLATLNRGIYLTEQALPDLAARLVAARDGVVKWLATEMTSPEGWFYSALDADSEGVEGKFYVWSEAELREVLGARAAEFMAAYAVRPEGNFEDEATRELTGDNVLHRIAKYDPAFDEDLAKLAEVRAHRPRPETDDKGLVGWNALAIKALCMEPETIPMAVRAIDAILAAEKKHGGLPRGIAKGSAFGRGYLEDYAYFAECLLGLFDTLTFWEIDGLKVPMDRPYRFFEDEGLRIAREMIAKFYDEESGGFFSTSEDHETLFGRTKPVFDQPLPSANAVAISILLRLDEIERAQKTVKGFLGWMERAPNATEALHQAALPLLGLIDVPLQVTQPVPAEIPPTPIAAPQEEVRVSISPREIVAGPDGTGTVEVRISIPAGLHLYGPKPADRWSTATAIKVRPIKAEPNFPPAPDDRYEGEIVIPIKLTLPAGESGAEYDLVVSFQACTESECRLAESRTFGGVIVRG